MEEIFVPALGVSAENVYLQKWLKAPGDSVQAGEAIAIIETESQEATPVVSTPEVAPESVSKIPEFSGANLSVTSSKREIAWKTVVTSWKPSAPNGPTANCKFILAGTRTTTPRVII